MAKKNIDISGESVSIKELVNYGKGLVEEYKDGELLNNDDKINAIAKEWLDKKGISIEFDEDLASVSKYIKDGYEAKCEELGIVPTDIPNNVSVTENEGRPETPPSLEMTNPPQKIDTNSDNKDEIETKDKPWWGNKANGIEEEIYDKYINDTKGEFADKREEISKMYAEGKESDALHNTYEFLLEKSDECRKENGIEPFEKTNEINYLGNKVPENSVETKYINSISKDLDSIGRNSLYKDKTPTTVFENKDIFRSQIRDKVDSVFDKKPFEGEVSQSLKEKAYERVEKSYSDTYAKSLHIDNRYIGYNRCDIAKEGVSALGSELARLGVFDDKKESHTDNPITRDCIDKVLKNNGIKDYGERVYEFAVNDMAKAYVETKNDTGFSSDVNDKESLLPWYLNNEEVLPEIRDSLISGDRSDDRISEMLDKFENISKDDVSAARTELYSDAVDYSNEKRIEQGLDPVEKIEYIDKSEDNKELVEKTDSSKELEIVNGNKENATSGSDLIERLPPNVKPVAYFVCDLANAKGPGDVLKAVGHLFVSLAERDLAPIRGILAGLDAAGASGKSDRIEKFDNAWKNMHGLFSVSPKEIQESMIEVKEWVEDNKSEIKIDNSLSENEMNDIVEKIDIAISHSDVDVIEGEGKDTVLAEDESSKKTNDIDSVINKIEPQDNIQLEKSTPTEKNINQAPDEFKAAITDDDDDTENKRTEVPIEKNSDNDDTDNLTDLVDDFVGIFNDNPDNLISYIAELCDPDGESPRDLGMAFAESLKEVAGDKDVLEPLGTSKEDFDSFLSKISSALENDVNSHEFYEGLSEGLKDASSVYNDSFSSSMDEAYDKLNTAGDLVVFVDTGESPTGIQNDSDAKEIVQNIKADTSEFILVTLDEINDVDTAPLSDTEIDEKLNHINEVLTDLGIDKIGNEDKVNNIVANNDTAPIEKDDKLINDNTDKLLNDTEIDDMMKHIDSVLDDLGIDEENINQVDNDNNQNIENESLENAESAFD